MCDHTCPYFCGTFYLWNCLRAAFSCRGFGPRYLTGISVFLSKSLFLRNILMGAILCIYMFFDVTTVVKIEPFSNESGWFYHGIHSKTSFDTYGTTVEVVANS